MVDPEIYLSISLLNFQFLFLLLISICYLFYTRLSPFKIKHKLEQKIHKKKQRFCTQKQHKIQKQKIFKFFFWLKGRIINAKCGNLKGTWCVFFFYSTVKNTWSLLLFFLSFSTFFFTFFYPVFSFICFIYLE